MFPALSITQIETKVKIVNILLTFNSLEIRKSKIIITMIRKFSMAFEVIHCNLFLRQFGN